MDESVLKRVAADALATSDPSSPNNQRNSMTSLHDPIRPRPSLDTGMGHRPLFGEIGTVSSSSSQDIFRSPFALPEPREPAPLVRQSSNEGRPVSRTGTGPISPHTRGNSIAISPKLRPYAIPASKGSPRETLPAMQQSPPTSAISPHARQSLPSLQSQLGDLTEGVPKPATTLPPPTHRSSFPTASGSLHSPKDLANPRTPYNILQPTRSNSGPFPTSYPTSEPSPASTASAISPREFRPGGPNNPLTRSPPSALGQPKPFTKSPPSSLKFPPPQTYPPPSTLTPQSEVQTPLSATTQHSMQTMSTSSSPRNEGGPEGGIPLGAGSLPAPPPRTLLPPIQTGGIGVGVGASALVNGGYKCDHPGCTAPPFQTQYLLK
jgi:hypothetical protein